MVYTCTPEILLRDSEQTDQPAEEGPDDLQSGRKAAWMFLIQTVFVKMIVHSVFSRHEY